MPLIKSPAQIAVGQNIAAEEAAGKPKDQAVAIALSTKDKAKGVKPPAPVGHRYNKFMK